MKPQGNRVGIWTDRNARSQRTIGPKEEAKANSYGRLLPENRWGWAMISVDIFRSIVYET